MDYQMIPGGNRYGPLFQEKFVEPDAKLKFVNRNLRSAIETKTGTVRLPFVGVEVKFFFCRGRAFFVTPVELVEPGPS